MGAANAGLPADFFNGFGGAATGLSSFGFP